MGAQRRVPRLAMLGVSLLLGAVASVRGQTTGSILGRIVDPTGAALPGVTIEAASPSLQGVRTATSNQDGSYRIPVVPPGQYRIRASLPGFRAAEKDATVRLDATATADFTLEPAAAEQVVVSGEAPRIDSTSTTTGTNYTSSVINHLPVARNYADIVKSNPGVSTDVGATQGRSLALTIYGATSAENQWIIDGVNTTNVYQGVQGKAINNEFVQEVEVKTGAYQAEYGRALGGVINVITKSGGNDFHGEGFVYYDSTGTRAEQQLKSGDLTITQTRVTDGERFDYGVDLGGYLLKDRLWFFGAYNRVTLDGHLSRVVPTTAVPAGSSSPSTPPTTSTRASSPGTSLRRRRSWVRSSPIRRPRPARREPIPDRAWASTPSRRLSASTPRPGTRPVRRGARTSVSG